MKQPLIINLVLIMSCALNSLFAARPFGTDDAGTVEPAMHELEVGCDSWEDYAALGLGFKHGLTERMDIGLGFEYGILPEDEEGFGGAEMALKFALIPDLFSASFTGGLGDNTYTLNGILTRTFDLAEVDLNFGYEASGIQGVEGILIYALAGIFIKDPFAFGVEIAGNEDDIESWLVGGRYSAFEGFAFDGGFSGTFEEDMEPVATIGIHFEF
jgi:hypothetical protein